jgi:hypothetical protein
MLVSISIDVGTFLIRIPSDKVSEEPSYDRSQCEEHPAFVICVSDFHFLVSLP